MTVTIFAQILPSDHVCAFRELFSYNRPNPLHVQNKECGPHLVSVDCINFTVLIKETCQAIRYPYDLECKLDGIKFFFIVHRYIAICKWQIYMWPFYQTTFVLTKDISIAL